MKAKTFYKLKLTIEDFELNKNKTLKEMENKFTIFKISDTKLESLKVNSFKKFLKAYKTFVKGYFELEKTEFAITKHTLRKYHKVSYNTSEKFLPIIDLIKSKIQNIKGTSFYISSNSTIKKLEDADLYFYYYEEVEPNSKEFDFLMDNLKGNED